MGWVKRLPDGRYVGPPPTARPASVVVMAACGRDADRPERGCLLGHVDLSFLTVRQRDIVEMHYASGLSFGAIAQLLGVSRQAVEQCHARALDRLRRTCPVDSAQQGVEA